MNMMVRPMSGEQSQQFTRAISHGIARVLETLELVNEAAQLELLLYEASAVPGAYHTVPRKARLNCRRSTWFEFHLYGVTGVGDTEAEAVASWKEAAKRYAKHLDAVAEAEELLTTGAGIDTASPGELVNMCELVVNDGKDPIAKLTAIKVLTNLRAPH